MNTLRQETAVEEECAGREAPREPGEAGEREPHTGSARGTTLHCDDAAPDQDPAGQQIGQPVPDVSEVVCLPLGGQTDGDRDEPERNAGQARSAASEAPDNSRLARKPRAGDSWSREP